MSRRLIVAYVSFFLLRFSLTPFRSQIPTKKEKKLIQDQVITTEMRKRKKRVSRWLVILLVTSR
jgi:hypothetical protein